MVSSLTRHLGRPVRHIDLHGQNFHSRARNVPKTPVLFGVTRSSDEGCGTYRGAKLMSTVNPFPSRRCIRIPGTARSLGLLANVLRRACSATNVFGSVYFPSSISVPLKNPEI